MNTKSTLKKHEFPILDYDYNKKSFIHPGSNKRNIKIPERCVMSFFGDVVKKYSEKDDVHLIGTMKWETGPVNVYEMNHKGKQVAFYHAWVGAPIAAGVMEWVIAYGAKKFIACGGCGVLDKDLNMGDVLIPTSAIRDEGTSYHYLAPSREISISEVGIKAIEDVLNEYEIKYRKCKTWTTDAFYRETVNIIEHRKTEGCTCVEMECSALAAVAEFRDVIFGQILYSGDMLDLEKYDHRDWQSNISVREKLFLLSLDATLEL